jgi:hypothetical protein
MWDEATEHLIECPPVLFSDETEPSFEQQKISTGEVPREGKKKISLQSRNKGDVRRCNNIPD